MTDSCKYFSWTEFEETSLELLLLILNRMQIKTFGSSIFAFVNGREM